MMPGENVIRRLTKCLELTSSSHDGETLAAIHKANAIRESLNLMWSDLLEGGNLPAKSLEQYEEMFSRIWAHNSPAGKWIQIIEDLESFAQLRGFLTPRQERLVKKFDDVAIERMQDAA